MRQATDSLAFLKQSKRFAVYRLLFTVSYAGRKSSAVRAALVPHYRELMGKCPTPHLLSSMDNHMTGSMPHPANGPVPVLDATLR